MARRHYDLVYQCGIATVFRVRSAAPEPGNVYTRLVQASFLECEWFVRGCLEAGANVSVWHSDVAGDVLQGPEWNKGPGTMFLTSKNTPGLCLYADYVEY